MPRQLSFAVTPAETRARDFIFLGVFFEPPVAANLTELAQQLRSKHGLIGKPLLPERFHTSLFDLGHYVGLNQGRVRDVIEAVAPVRMSAFDVTFDCVMSFGRNAAKFPLVLRTGADATKLIEFHRNLGTALNRAGLDVRLQFSPHITLLYDAKSVPQEPIEPVHVRVNRLTLVHSVQGETRHVKLAQWDLHS